MYTCELFLKIRLDLIPDLLSNAISMLDFTPITMDVFYNEFKKSKDFIEYNREYIINNLSKSEMDDGITRVSFYDGKYTRENITPFFRFGINDTTFNEELVSCTFEWVAYQNLDWLLKDEFILKNLLIENIDLVYLLAYNQNDTYLETTEDNKNTILSSKLFEKKNWGRKVVVNGLTFIAAPLMYFGKAYNKVILMDNIKTDEKAKTFRINGSEVIKIEIFPLYKNAKEYRKEQETYWKKINLSKQIERYKKETTIDFTEFLKKRSSLKK